MDYFFFNRKAAERGRVTVALAYIRLLPCDLQNSEKKQVNMGHKQHQFVFMEAKDRKRVNRDLCMVRSNLAF